MTYEAHCLKCETVTDMKEGDSFFVELSFKNNKIKIPNHGLMTGSIARVEHETPEHKPCDGECLFCLKD